MTFGSQHHVVAGKQDIRLSPGQGEARQAAACSVNVARLKSELSAFIQLFQHLANVTQHVGVRRPG